MAIYRIEKDRGERPNRHGARTSNEGRVTMSQRMPTPNPEDERADLLATLAAARELGPEMDPSLVDSYMRRRGAERTRQGAPGQPGQSGWPALGGYPRIWLFIGLGLLGAAVVAGTIASFYWAAPAGTAGAANGDHWGFPFWLPWLFFPWLFFVFFGRRGFYRSRRHYWYETEDGRRVYVTERSRGYSPDDPDGRGSSGDPRDPYAPPPPQGQRPPAGAPGHGTEYGADYRTDYGSGNRGDYWGDRRRDSRTD
jgi:hypothetical protein